MHATLEDLRCCELKGVRTQPALWFLAMWKRIQTNHLREEAFAASKGVEGPLPKGMQLGQEVA